MSLELWISVFGALIVPLGILYVRVQLTKADKAAADRKAERDNQIEEEKHRREEKDRENEAVHKELRQYIERLNTDHYTLRLDIANSYVTKMNLEQLETRIFRAVERIESKLDHVISKRRVDDE